MGVPQVVVLLSDATEVRVQHAISRQFADELDRVVAVVDRVDVDVGDVDQQSGVSLLGDPAEEFVLGHGGSGNGEVVSDILEKERQSDARPGKLGVLDGRRDAEVGVEKRSGRELVRVNPEFYRPAEVELLIGSPEKAEHHRLYFDFYIQHFLFSFYFVFSES